MLGLALATRSLGPEKRSGLGLSVCSGHRLRTGKNVPPTSFNKGAADFWRHDELDSEIVELLNDSNATSHVCTTAWLASLNSVAGSRPLQAQEVLPAFGASRVTALLPPHAVVCWYEEMRTQSFFVTLEKTVKNDSPTTRYLDHAIGNCPFHYYVDNYEKG